MPQPNCTEKTTVVFHFPISPAIDHLQDSCITTDSLEDLKYSLSLIISLKGCIFISLMSNCTEKTTNGLLQNLVSLSHFVLT
jgi:hypothetical protein